MSVTITQKAFFNDDARKRAAIIEIKGVRFFSVTPGNAAEADKINHVFRDAVIRPLGVKWTPTEQP